VIKCVNPVKWLKNNMTVMLKVKQKKLSLIAKFEKQELATNLSKGYYGIGLQNIRTAKFK
jgi:hypothetical protein